MSLKVISLIVILTIFAIIVFGLIYQVAKIKKEETFKNNLNNKKSDKKSDKKVRFIFDRPLTESEKAGSLYSPFVIRPKDKIARNYTGGCTNVLFPKSTSPFGEGEMGMPCSSEVEAKYYGMRPILTPGEYDKLLTLIFNRVKDQVPDTIHPENLIYPATFVNSDIYSDIIKYVMKRINKSKTEIKPLIEYAKSDTWGGEQFAYTNEKVYAYTDIDQQTKSEQQQAKDARKIPDKTVKYILTFTLHNTLRSASSDLVAIIYGKRTKFYIEYIDFVSKASNNEGVIPVQPGGFKTGGIINTCEQDLPPGAGEPSWIYGNTLQNQTFNLKGFHDPDEKNNILIPGGVPESFEEVLNKCDQGYLLEPANSDGPRFKGGFQNNNSTMEPNVYPNYPDKNNSWNVFV